MKKAYACFDIGGSSIKVAVITKAGEKLESGKIATGKSFTECIDLMVDTLDDVKKRFLIEGVAISAPGAVDSESGLIGGQSALDFIHGPNWKDVWREKTGFEIGIENDANCAALAELYYGEGKQYNDLAYVVLGTGVGGAVVKDKKVHKGVHLHSGEFGYMILDVNPLTGEYRTWSHAASTIAMVREANKKLGRTDLDGQSVFALAEQGDVMAQEVIDTFYFYNAMGIYNIQFTFDPEIILLGGGISQREDFEENIQHALAKIMKNSEAKVYPLVKVGKFKDDANLYGALANLLQQEAE